jgi:hypothetical protein
LNPSAAFSDAKPKKSNPLNDLIDTEKTYVEQLTGIIRVRSNLNFASRSHWFIQKVAAAWSRSNLPPADLDVMFRSIEGVYKANRGLHSVSLLLSQVFHYLTFYQEIKRDWNESFFPKSIRRSADAMGVYNLSFSYYPTSLLYRLMT